MNPTEIKAIVDAAIDSKVILSYPQVVIFLLLSWLASYIGAYLKQRGQNLATKEDITTLTHGVEAIKGEYSRQMEDYKSQLTQRDRAAKIAGFFALWDAWTPERITCQKQGWRAVRPNGVFGSNTETA